VHYLLLPRENCTVKHVLHSGSLTLPLMRRLLLAIMQHQRHMLCTSRSVQALSRPSAVVSFHGTTPPPPARQLLRDCYRVPHIYRHTNNYASSRFCNTVARSGGSDEPDSTAAVDSTDAPAASADQAAETSSTEAVTAAVIETQQASVRSPSSSEPVQLQGSLHTVWASFLEHLWERGYFADSSTTEK
jgi:hypothetical protein